MPDASDVSVTLTWLEMKALFIRLKRIDVELPSTALSSLELAFLSKLEKLVYHGLSIHEAECLMKEIVGM